MKKNTLNAISPTTKKINRDILTEIKLKSLQLQNVKKIKFSRFNFAQYVWHKFLLSNLVASLYFNSFNSKSDNFWNLVSPSESVCLTLLFSGILSVLLKFYVKGS